MNASTLLGQLGNHFAACLLFLGFVAGSGCTFADKTSPIGEGFGLKKYGNPMPHSPSYISLMRTNDSGKWVVVWQAISLRFKGIAVSNKAIVFGGIADHVQSGGFVRCLYFSQQTGVVDLTDSIVEKAGVTNKVNVTWIHAKQSGASVEVRMTIGKDVKTEATFVQLAEMARVVVARKNKKTFDGIDFFE